MLFFPTVQQESRFCLYTFRSHKSISKGRRHICLQKLLDNCVFALLFASWYRWWVFIRSCRYNRVRAAWIGTSGHQKEQEGSSWKEEMSLFWGHGGCKADGRLGELSSEFNKTLQIIKKCHYILNTRLGSSGVKWNASLCLCAFRRTEFPFGFKEIYFSKNSNSVSKGNSGSRNQKFYLFSYPSFKAKRFTYPGFGNKGTHWSWPGFAKGMSTS